MPKRMNQIQKLLVLGLFLAVSLDACLGRQKLNAKAMQEFAEAIVQGKFTSWYVSGNVMVIITMYFCCTCRSN